MVLPFAGGVSPPLLVVSLLFSASYPQASRSYYLFFNYLYVLPVSPENQRAHVTCFTEEKLSGSPKPVEISHLRLLTIRERGEA